jgi:hypothetical protein
MIVPYGAENLIADSALDPREMNISAYWDSLFDESLVRLLPGEQPSWFTIAPLTVAQKQAAPPAGASVLDRAAWYVRCGLMRVENYMIQSAAGDAPAAQPDRKDTGRLGEMASEKWFQDVNFSEEDTIALYRMIYHISEAQHPLSRRSVRPPGATASNETKTESQA